MNQEIEIENFLKGFIFRMPVSDSHIRFVFRKDGSYMAIDADRLLENPHKQIHQIFNYTLYDNQVINSGQTDIHIGLLDLRTHSNNDSDDDSTLLNASFDNTNFVFEVTGSMDDEKMAHFNDLFKVAKRKGKICYDVAVSDRMKYLHEIGCDLKFVDTAKPLAKKNLVMCGGKEMPEIVAGMLKKFYFENLSATTTVENCIEYLADNDVADYGFDDLKDTYRGKVAQFLLCTFTGMRLGSPWNGRQDVNGGYIVVKNNGDVVAFHSTIADEFKDFLVAR